MTDRTIDSAIFDATDEYGLGGAVCFTTQSIGYACYVDSTGDVVLAKTTDGGSNWTAANTTIDNAENFNNVAMWYEPWTDGDSGTKIHLAFIGPADTLKYSYFDTSGETVRSGGTVSVVSVTAFAPPDGPVSICKATDGDLYITGTGNGGTFVYRSEDGGDNWSDISDATHNSTLDDDDDVVAVTPLTSGDIMLIAYDNTAGDWISRVWDVSGTSWDASFTTIRSLSSTGASRKGSVASDHSGNVYLTFAELNATQAFGNGFLVYKWSSGSWAQKTSPIGSTSDWKGDCAISVDTTTGDLYSTYIRGSSGSTDCYYVKSTDDGSNWGSETQLNSTTDDLRWCRPTPIAIGGDRLYGVWYNDDLNDMIGENIAAISAATADHEITPAQGNLTYSTTAPTVDFSENREIQPAQGNLTYSTTAPTVEVLQAPIEITPPKGDLALSSTIPTVDISDNREIQPGKGDLSLSTTAPTVEFSDNREITPNSGDLTYSTTAPTVEVAAGIQITPAQGNLSLSTTSPIIEVSENREITPAKGDLELSSTAPIVEIAGNVDHEITPPQGNLILTSFAPQIEVSGELEGGTKQKKKKRKAITDVALTRKLEQAKKLVEKAKEKPLTTTEEERAKRIIREITEVKQQQIDIPELKVIILNITIVLGQLALLNQVVARALYRKQLQNEDEEILLILASGL